MIFNFKVYEDGSIDLFHKTTNEFVGTIEYFERAGGYLFIPDHDNVNLTIAASFGPARKKKISAICDAMTFFYENDPTQK